MIDINYMLFWGIGHYLGNDCNIVLNGFNPV